MLIIFLVSLIQLQGRSVDAAAVLEFIPLYGESLKVGGTLRRQCLVSEGKKEKEIPFNRGWTVYWIVGQGTKLGSGYLGSYNIHPYMNGIYKCVASKPGKLPISNSFYLDIKEGLPGVTVYFKIQPDERLVRGGKVDRECVASQLGWSFKWQKPSGSEIDNGKLILSNLDPKMSGNYSCIASTPGRNPIRLIFSLDIN